MVTVECVDFYERKVKKKTFYIQTTGWIQKNKKTINNKTQERFVRIDQSLKTDINPLVSAFSFAILTNFSAPVWGQ